VNTLTLLPARVRQAVYVAYGLLALSVSAIQVGYNSLSVDNPPWLIVATAVIGFLAVPVGAIAALNVSPEPRRALLED
jgi:uncharacterized membrane protein YfcA